jgi:myo-inositol-1(or 4)-monophosphatase
MDTAPYTPEIRKELFDNLLKLSHLCMDMRSIGSAALSICYVACGRSAAYLSPKLCVWDYAAASVILTEAGGIITDWDGKELGLATGVSVLTGTPKAHREAASML